MKMIDISFVRHPLDSKNQKEATRIEFEAT